MQNSWGLKRDISPCFGARLVQDAYSHRDRSVIRMTIDHDFA
ncbi:type IV toxin-antitoxin system YeeU family antitoxin [Sodalis praecaptivus]